MPAVVGKAQRSYSEMEELAKEGVEGVAGPWSRAISPDSKNTGPCCASQVLGHRIVTVAVHHTLESAAAAVERLLSPAQLGEKDHSHSKHIHIPVRPGLELSECGMRLGCRAVVRMGSAQRRCHILAVERGLGRERILGDCRSLGLEIESQFEASIDAGSPTWLGPDWLTRLDDEARLVESGRRGTIHRLAGWSDCSLDDVRCLERIGGAPFHWDCFLVCFEAKSHHHRRQSLRFCGRIDSGSPLDLRQERGVGREGAIARIACNSSVRSGPCS